MYSSQVNSEYLCCILLTFQIFLAADWLCTVVSPNNIITVYWSAIHITRMEMRIIIVHGNISYPCTMVVTFCPIGLLYRSRGGSDGPATLAMAGPLFGGR